MVPQSFDSAMQQNEFEIPEFFSEHILYAYFGDARNNKLNTSVHFFVFEAGVLLEGGNMFVQNSDTFIRLNLAMPRALLEKGLERIAAALNKIGR